MWVAYSHWMRLGVIEIRTGYVPFAGLIVVTTGFWAIASVCGLGISGVGFFLLQSVSSDHVNTVLDLAVTGLAIGAGTKPVHDLITSIQSKAASSGTA